MCDVFRQFVNLLVSGAQSRGMRMSGRPIISMNAMNDRKQHVSELYEILKQLQDQYRCQMVLVVIPRKLSPLYAQVKQAAELCTGVGLLTQCVIENNVNRCQPATVQNILLKLNSKMGGINHLIQIPSNLRTQLMRIDWLACPMLIMGAGEFHSFLVNTMDSNEYPYDVYLQT